MARMSRGIRSFTLATTLVLTALAAPASADRGFDVPDNAVVTIKGDGSGHGRGMSQYGAYSAARKGVKHRKILGTYYPKTRWAKGGGSVEVLVSADDDNDLVVRDTKRLKVKAVGGRSWAADKPGATRWRIQPTPAGDNEVSYLDGSWTTWRTISREAEFRAGKRKLSLITPDGTVAYRGSLRSSVDDFGDRVTVNVVGLEPYVRGVVPSEMAAGWPQQALRAQAVASRSYAAWRRGHPIDVAYDLCDSALCQVYGGASAEHAASNKATRGTAKQVLTFRRKPIFAEFSAANGGHTVSGGKRYLPARRDPYEGRSSDYYGWKRTITAAEMEAEYNYDDLDRIRIVARDGRGRRGGRVEQVRVTAGSGFTDTVTGDDFRRDWGLPSTLFTIANVR